MTFSAKASKSQTSRRSWPLQGWFLEQLSESSSTQGPSFYYPARRSSKVNDPCGGNTLAHHSVEQQNEPPSPTCTLYQKGLFSPSLSATSCLSHGQDHAHHSWQDQLLWLKNVTCQISKPRVLWPSSPQQPLSVCSEGIQDGKKQDTGPR